jgi:hypothetical protein
MPRASGEAAALARRTWRKGLMSRKRSGRLHVMAPP